jgi:septal ring factor EnvC (AmiA/AmiB activator)
MILKRCQKCGAQREVPSRDRRCKVIERRFGRQYYCWGTLTRVRSRKRPPITKALTPVDTAARGEQVRQQAKKDLARTRRQIGDKTRTLTATVAYISKYAKQITKLEARAARLARRASMTDDEIEAERQRAIATLRKRDKRTREITLED